MNNIIDPRNIIVKLTNLHYIFAGSKYLNVNEYVLDCSQVFQKRDKRIVAHGLIAITNRALYFKKNKLWNTQQQQDYVETMDYSSFPRDLDIYPFTSPGVDHIYDTREVFQFGVKSILIGKNSEINVLSQLNSDVVSLFKKDFNYDYEHSSPNTEEIYETFSAPKWFIKSFEKIYNYLIELEDSGLEFSQQFPEHFGDYVIFGQETYEEEGLNSSQGYVDIDGTKLF